MAQSAQIQKLSPKHEEMVRFLIENPTASRREMACHFGVTVPWLSTIIHSDAFQAQLHTLQERVNNAALIRPIQERLLGAAHIALDRLTESLSVETKTEVLTRSVEVLTKATGDFRGEPKAPGSSLNVQVNGDVSIVSREDLERARELVGKAKSAGGLPQIPSPSPALLSAFNPSPALQGETVLADSPLPEGSPL